MSQTQNIAMASGSPTRLQVPPPLGLSRDDIEGIADLVREEIKFDVFEGNLADAVETLGGSIERANWDRVLDPRLGSLEVRGRQDWTIYLPSFTGPFEDRFTIAHEIGHFVLHSRMGNVPLKVNLDRDTKLQLVEQEANWFAAAWLMPKSLFAFEAKLGTGSPEYLAGRFRVARRAAERRLKEVFPPTTSQK